MHKFIKFAKRPSVNSHGRNGFIRTTGVEVTRRNGQALLPGVEEASCVTLQPITSKGVVSESCRVSIPLGAVPDLIRALQEIDRHVADMIWWTTN